MVRQPFYVFLSLSSFSFLSFETEDLFGLFRLCYGEIQIGNEYHAL